MPICPNCFNDYGFIIHARIECLVYIGLTYPPKVLVVDHFDRNNAKWDGESQMQCSKCWHNGKVGEFINGSGK